MAEEMLPLFPLKVVLFPGSALPLHIFEDRYRILVRECLEKSGMEFGINLVEGEKLSFVGCTAVVREVVKRYEDGRFDIVVEGMRRYKLHGMDQDKAPYYVGRVTFLEDETDEVDMTLLNETADLYNRLVKSVYENRLLHISATIASRPISFVMAQKIGMALRGRQDLLEMRSENERLRSVHGYLADVVPKLKRSQEVQRIINNDGYIINP